MVKRFNIEKKLSHVSLINILRYNFFTSVYQLCLPLCVLKRGRHYHIKGKRNVWSKNFGDRNTNYVFWLKVCLFRGCIKTSLNQYEQKSLNTTRHGNWNISAPKTGVIWKIKSTTFCLLVLKSSFSMQSLIEALERFEVGVKITVFVFFNKRLSFCAKHNFLKNSCHITLYCTIHYTVYNALYTMPCTVYIYFFLFV